jgi:NhaP-type Na+/H+ or K+/H+ antiporter
MAAHFQVFLILLVVLAGTALVARRTNIAPAILLMLAGIGLAFVPGMPAFAMPPELVLLVVLPPLIYAASVAMSWREFKYNLRSISLLAFGCVIFTAFAVAIATHYLIGLPWSMGFLLGAIVATPDVVEIAFGVAIGWVMLRARHYSRDPQVEITLSLLTPYLAYWIPEHVGGSGVIATVACGLYMSWNGPLLISAATRLQGIFFWDLVIYLVEGLLFLLTGFQLRLLYEKSKAFPLQEIMASTALVVAVIVIARFAWVFPAIFVPRWLSRRLRERDPAPPWQWAFIISFTGVRGTVSLAAALALPLTLSTGEAFPARDLILFISFGVIFVTLVGFGLTLPRVVRWLGVTEAGKNELVAQHGKEIAARREVLSAALQQLDAITDDRELSDEVVKLLRARQEVRTSQLPPELDCDEYDVSALGIELTRELIGSERKFIHAMLRDGKITDEIRRRIERDLDLEEASLANREFGEAPL